MLLRPWSKDWILFREDRPYDVYRNTSETNAQRVHLKVNPYRVEVKSTTNWHRKRQATWVKLRTVGFDNFQEAHAFFEEVVRNPDLITMEEIL